MAERAGFEPAVPCGTLHFQCSTIGHSVTSPEKQSFHFMSIMCSFVNDQKRVVEFKVLISSSFTFDIIF